MPRPDNPKIYHIVHVDRLASIIADGHLWCDADIVRRNPAGTTIGMNATKERRLNELMLASHPDLYVGHCVPFYFCPRSIMLYLIYQRNHPELAYKGGQGSIIHLECDLQEVVDWAHDNERRWAFTSSNAGSNYFADFCDLAQLNEIKWNSVNARDWSGCKEGKQAEFLLEHAFPWELVRRIGVRSQATLDLARAAMNQAAHRPQLAILPEWYY